MEEKDFEEWRAKYPSGFTDIEHTIKDAFQAGEKSGRIKALEWVQKQSEQCTARCPDYCESVDDIIEAEVGRLRNET